MSHAQVVELQRRFGRRMAELRATVKLTQRELARRAGLSLQFVRKVEQGARAPSFGSLVRLAHALGTSPAELFNFSAEPLAPPRVEGEWIRLRELLGIRPRAEDVRIVYGIAERVFRR